MRALRRLGVRIAIDDFGAGHASLSHLRTVPADIIKIDKQFTDDLVDAAAPYENALPGEKARSVENARPHQNARPYVNALRYENAYPVAKALVVLASTLGSQAIAEGVECAGQVDRLVELGCTLGQGYHFGRPMTADGLTELLASPTEQHWRTSPGLVAFHG